jgi:hypothetical protein
LRRADLLAQTDDLGVVCRLLRACPVEPFHRLAERLPELGDDEVFAVYTTRGNYTKVQVLRYGSDLELRFETYRR